MKQSLRYIPVALVLLLAGCSKDINLNLPNPPPEAVVEGHIEPNNLAYLYLSHNFNFFGNISVNTILANDVIHGAKITLFDGTTTDTMTEYIPLLGFYQSKTMKGVVGKTYTLTVVTGGQTLTAVTNILKPIKLDSAWFKVQPALDTLGFIWAKLTDPLPVGNCYRWMAKRLGKDTTYLAPSFSVFNDQYFPGDSITFSYNRGQIPGSKAIDDTDKEAGYFKKGETVVVKFCVISYTAYNFYNTYYFQQNNIGNPFGSPSTVEGNINGGLGIWCGYGTSFDTVICK